MKTVYVFLFWIVRIVEASADQDDYNFLHSEGPINVEQARSFDSSQQSRISRRDNSSYWFLPHCRVHQAPYQHDLIKGTSDESLSAVSWYSADSDRQDGSEPDSYEFTSVQQKQKNDAKEVIGNTSNKERSGFSLLVVAQATTRKTCDVGSQVTEEDIDSYHKRSGTDERLHRSDDKSEVQDKRLCSDTKTEFQRVVKEKTNCCC